MKGIVGMSDILNVPEIFGSDVFNEATMKQRLAPETYCAWKHCIEAGSPLQLDVAQEIAEAMKNWAIEKGATIPTGPNPCPASPQKSTIPSSPP